jgi:hypothetical protein
VVSAGWSKAFTGIQAGTIVTLTYKDSSGCQFQSWWVSGGQAPTGNPIAVTVNSDREVIALCLPVTNLTVYSEGCCEIQVTWDGGSGTVNAQENETFVLPPGTEVTLSAQPGVECYLSYWMLDGEFYSEGSPIVVTMDVDHTATAICQGGYIIQP